MADRDNFGAESPARPQGTPIGPAGWVALIVLGGFLAVTACYAIYGWGRLEGVATISSLGWVFLVGGVIATLGVGMGLMALVFYSSRKNYDQ